MKTLRIFISSPGDVQEERIIAGRVIERLQGKYWSFVRLDDVFWEYKAVRATAHYQEELTNPGECDIVLGILWSRLGSPLPERFRDSNTRISITGTEWELEQAFAAYERSRMGQGESHAKPDILVYRRKQVRPVRDTQAAEQQAADSEAALQDYLTTQYFYPDGTIRRPLLSYRSPEEFEEKLHAHLEQLILRQIPRLKSGYEPPPISGSPYKNLTHFDFDDADRFFGRNRAIREVQQKLLHQAAQRHASFVLIYGASGHGKSSLMRAGLAPALTRPGALVNSAWRRVLMRPQNPTHGPLCEQLARAIFTRPTPAELERLDTLDHWPLPGLPEMAREAVTSSQGSPAKACWDIASFSRALADEEQLAHAVAAIALTLKNLDRHLLIQVDQLEEAFTHDAIRPEERETFLRAISALSRCGRIWTLATMRSEFFPRIATCPPLHHLIQQGGGYILQPVSDHELREIIRYPAFAARLGFDRLIEPRKIGDALSTSESLDDQILSDAKGSQDALPLLEFTLHELYQAIAPDTAELPRKGDTLLWDDYARIGGLKGAIATVAEEAYRSLRVEEQQAADKIFGNLVRVDAGNSDNATRLRTPLETLECAAPGAAAFIRAFRERNLLIADEDQSTGRAVMTLAHESLLSHWPILRDWVRDHRGILRSRQRLREHCAQWQDAVNQNIKQNGRRPAAYLLSSGRLAEAEEVEKCGSFTDITKEEKALIHQSRKASTKRVRFFQAAAAVFALLAIGACALGWVANRQKLEANRQKAIAQQSEKQALNARNTAEGLINSMLFDLRDKLKPLGRIELLDDVSKQAERYFSNNPPTESTAMRNVGAMHSNRGGVLHASGDLKGARTAYEKSLEISRNLAAADPGNIKVQRDLNLSYQNLGDIAKAQGDIKTARAAYEKSLEVALHISTTDPDNMDFLYYLGMCHSNLGQIAQVDGDSKFARRAYEKSCEIFENLAAAKPGSIKFQQGLSSSLNLLGGIARAEGDLKGVRAMHEKSLKIALDLSTSNPDNAVIRRGLGVAYVKLGDIAHAEGDLAAARAALENGSKVYQRLVTGDPLNADIQLELGVCYSRLANIRQSEGDLESAQMDYKRSMEINQRLIDIDPRNREAMRGLAMCLREIGEYAHAKGDLKGSHSALRKCLAIFRDLGATDPDNFQVLMDLSYCYWSLGMIARAEDDFETAREHFGKCLAIRQRLANENPENAGIQRNLCLCYCMLGGIAKHENNLKFANELYEKGLEISKRMVQAEPANTDAQRNLSICYNNLGDLAKARGDMKSAREYYEKDLETCQRVATALPRDAVGQMSLLVSHIALSELAKVETNSKLRQIHLEACYSVLKSMEEAGMDLNEHFQGFYAELKAEFGEK